MSDTTARDQLAGELLGVLAVVSNFPQHAQVRLLGQDMRPLAEKCSDAILAAGWRPPARVVTTVDELDALPELAVIRDREGIVAEFAFGMWFSSDGRVFGLRLPATVLWEPEEGE